VAASDFLGAMAIQIISTKDIWSDPIATFESYFARIADIFTVDGLVGGGRNRFRRTSPRRSLRGQV
jgi:hypothetical protein